MWAVVYTALLLLIQINDTKLIKKKCLVNWPNSKFLQENQMRDDRIRIPLKYLDEQRVLANLCHHQSDRLSLYFFSLLQRCSVESVLHSLLDTVHVRVSKWVCKEEFRKNHFATLFLKRDLPSGSGWVCVRVSAQRFNLELLVWDFRRWAVLSQHFSPKSLFVITSITLHLTAT